MPSDLQHVVDVLGAALGRSVAVDDRGFNLLAYSPHFGPVDDVRLASVLHKVPPQAAIDYAHSLGVRGADGPMRLPANPSLAYLARLCIPVIFEEVRLGYLFIIDADESLSDDEVEDARVAAGAAAVAIYRERLEAQLAEGRERELIRDLLDQDSSVRAQAAWQLVDEDLVRGDVVTALSIEPRDLGAAREQQIRLALNLALAETRRVLPLHQVLHLERQNHGLLLMTATGSAGAAALGRAAADLRRSFTRHAGQPFSAAVVGIGDSHGSLTEAHISYRQAREAARVARTVPGIDAVARWSNLGVYQLLVQMPPNALTAAALPPALLRLMEINNGAAMIETLECFLDVAGDVRRTAQRLVLHRASIYQRLARIENVCGADLSDGGQRLALHLGLKTARLAGLLSVGAGTATTNSRTHAETSAPGDLTGHRAASD